MLSFTRSRLARQRIHRTFSLSASALAHRAIVYSENGPPNEKLRALTFGPLARPPAKTVNIRFLLAPINPSDVNVIEGVYPSKPTITSLGDVPDIFIAGNEGLAIVTQTGPGVTELKENDWVIMTKQQSGTWTSAADNVGVDDVLKVPGGLSEVNAATMTVNTPTAWNMLTDFVNLEKGDWVLQNGANSAVGQAAIQIAASRGINTINLVRNRDNISDLVKMLEGLGATKVLTYDDLADRNLRNKVNAWTGGKSIRLGLNCVGGNETTQMARLLGNDAHLVSYGAMSKSPLSLPTSLFIFKNLTTHGYWQTRWYAQHSREEKSELMGKLAALCVQGKLKEPEHEIVVIPAEESDEAATKRVRDIFTKMSEGKYGKKVLLKIEETL